MGGRQILWRTIFKMNRNPATMHWSSTSPEGCFAINKPPTISSAQVIRDVQRHFNPSKLFSPWIQKEEARLDSQSQNNRRGRNRRNKRPQQLKMGHGGTLDPMATGVLILGVGSGTKSLGNFLACTKSYECVLLFGKATDSYDTEGRVVAKKAYEHITKEMVEEALAKFRGSLMQRPPIFSALRMDGKRLYDYAREGKELPREIEERPVEVHELEMVEWMEGGTHKYHWPEAQADPAEKKFADKVLHLNADTTPEPQAAVTGETPEMAVAAGAEAASSSDKRKRDDETVSGTVEPEGPPSPKRARAEGEPEVSGALPAESTTEDAPKSSTEREPCPAPACRLRMTSGGGFYVRSLCQDLGVEVGSLGMMTELIRTRQGDFELGKNVFEYGDLARGEESWAPKVTQMLTEWTEKEAAGGSSSSAPAEERSNGNREGGGEKIKQEAKPALRRNSSSE